ncbi:MAG TPA: hypothetical protein PKC28_10870 [Bdellovibrionales bacterium]|nr:hypothetical protein [Bdellovibrionales bacterium]
MKVLYLYSSGEFPTRKTVWSFIFAFRRHSDHLIYYHNVSITPLPFWVKWVSFDLIVYSHYMTTPWNPERYRWRLEKLANSGLRGSRRVAFFQDEFFAVDLRSEFLSRLNVDTIYSVAPESEWPKIYPNLATGVEVRPYLTGYVDPSDVANHEVQKTEVRPIDVGYRTGWPSTGMYKLGRFGALKFRIAEIFNARKGDLNFDIQTGSGFFNGSAWMKFLSKCRYVLGVESGASLLDHNGAIGQCIQAYLEKSPTAGFDEVEKNCFPGLDGNLRLRAISPRVFEAAMTQTGLLLVEGEYNGILKAGEHYLPIAPDFSNIEQVLEDLKDEELRDRLVKTAHRDLIASGKYTFASFVDGFFCSMEVKSHVGELDRLAYLMSRLTDAASWSALALLTALRRLRLALRALKLTAPNR